MTNQPVSFLTGATGFVGAAVARILESKGHHLRLLARTGSDRSNLDDLQNYEVIEGDLTRPESYTKALEGCDYVFHVAADYRIWVPDETAMNRVNIDGTRALFSAALKAGVKKIIYTSSVATIGLPKDGSAGQEDTPVSVNDMVGTYKRSKFLAEEMVQKMIAEQKLPAVIVSPSTPIGPRDVKPTPTGRIIIEAATGRMPAFVDTGLNIVHVDDVAMGHYLALEKGEIGERYILGGEDMDFGSMLAVIAGLSGRNAPTIKIPRGPLFPLAYIAEFIARFTGKEPFITVDGLKMSKKKMYFSSAKAKSKLGYTPRPAKEALADAIAWFKQKGRL